MLYECYRASEFILTARNDHPDKVARKVIGPEIISLRPAVCDTFHVVVEHACRIVKD